MNTIYTMKPIHAGTILFVAVLMLAGMANAQVVHHAAKKSTENEETMISEMQKNKKVVRKLYEQVLNKREFELLSDFISEEFTGINGRAGAAGFREPVLALITAIPDVQWVIEELMSEGEKVMVKWTVEGTHTGPFQNVPATGAAISNNGIGIFELKEGKITGAYVQTDRLGFLQQLEVLPYDLLTPRTDTEPNDEQVRFIDKFLIPKEARHEFTERVRINRAFIRELPGFIEDAAYESIDEDGNLVYITIAVWKNAEALENAKKAVQAEYKKQGFDPAEMFERLHITMDRGTYKKADR